jgi:ribosomal protein S12 methylthiotransferase accessory factor YcaO
VDGLRKGEGGVTNFSALRERCEQGASRDLDRDLHNALVGKSYRTTAEAKEAGVTALSAFGMPFYTRLLDDALSLKDKVFPGWTWSVSQNPGEPVEAWIAHPTENALLAKASGSGSSDSAAMAVVLAILELVEARQPTASSI